MAKQNQLKNPTYCQVEEPSRPDDAEQAVQVLEHGLQDLGDRRRRAHLPCVLHARFICRLQAWIEICTHIYVCMLAVLRVEAIVDDAIHVEVEVVVDDAIRAPLWFILCGGDDAWVFGHKPLVERRYPHGWQL